MHMLLVIIIIIVIFLLCNKKDSNEGFYFKSPPLAYDADACGRMADNTEGVNSYYYDPSTRFCHLNTLYHYGDLYYPSINNTYWWSPTRYRYGKFRGEANHYSPPKTVKSYKTD